MNFRRIWNILFYLIIPLAAIIYLILQPSREKTSLEYSNKIKKELYQGLIVEKYIDKKQHYSKVIKIASKDTIIWVLTYDKSGLYDYLQEGDSINKAVGSYEVTVFRKNKRDTSFILNYGQNEAPTKRRMPK